MRLGQNVDVAAAGGIGVAAAVGGLAGGTHGLANVGRRLAGIATYGGYRAHGAALAGVAHGHGTASSAAKTLHGDGAVGLYADIHSPTLGPMSPIWQAGGGA